MWLLENLTLHMQLTLQLCRLALALTNQHPLPGTEMDGYPNKIMALSEGRYLTDGG